MINAEQLPVIVPGIPTEQQRPSSIDAYTDTTDLYPVVRGRFNNFVTSYILQGGNGPCPLLAVCNVLLFRGELSLPESIREISFAELVGKLANVLIDKNKAAENDETLRSTLDKSVSLLGTLNKGLDVNVKFSGVEGFEYTPEMSIFDLLDIHVYHGWVVSEDDLSAYPYVIHLSYNQAMEKLTQYEDVKAKVMRSTDIDSVTAEFRGVIEEGDAIAKWLNDTQNQLTSDGIIHLNSTLQNLDLAVLFRNNHFSVLHKRNESLFALVTDVGFKNTGVMWESIDQLDGDTLYLDSSFCSIRPDHQRTSSTPAETDYDMAMRLQYGARTNSIIVPPGNVSTVRQPKRCCSLM